jgi:hypothetical protein
MKELAMPVVNGNVEEYWESGGKLDKNSFEKARGVLSEQAYGEKRRVNDSSLSRAESMARFSKITITPEQRYLYAVLRDTTGETEEGSGSSPEKPGAVPVWALTDQRLLAEVIRLTDKTNLDSFMRAYPNIFDITK